MTIHIVGGQLPSPHAGRPRGGERLRDPLGIERLAENLEARRALAVSDGEQSLPQLHPHPSRLSRERIEKGRLKIQNFNGPVLSDRHCG